MDDVMCGNSTLSNSLLCDSFCVTCIGKLLKKTTKGLPSTCSVRTAKTEITIKAATGVK